jgi:hypothetical protein
MSPKSLHVLLTESLATWGVQGHVTPSPADDVLVVRVAGARLGIARAAPTVPFRWTLDDGTRTRAFASVPALLRGLRQVLDPSHRIVSVRIAQLPMALP